MDKHQVDKFITHLAHVGYDPIKAHQYYILNRDLKGRANSPSDSGSSDSQSTQSTSEDASARAPTPAPATAQPTQPMSLDAIQQNAADTAKRIQDKLAAFLEAISTNTPIPANASPALRAFLEKQQKNRAAGALKQAAADMQKLGDEIKAEVAKAREALKKGPAVAPSATKKPTSTSSSGSKPYVNSRKRSAAKKAKAESVNLNRLAAKDQRSNTAKTPFRKRIL